MTTERHVTIMRWMLEYLASPELPYDERIPLLTSGISLLKALYNPPNPASWQASLFSFPHIIWHSPLFFFSSLCFLQS